MALDIPVPTQSPYDDPDQYLPLILSAIEGFLLARDVWTPETYEAARGYMEQLKHYAVDCWGKCGDGAMIGEIKAWCKSNVPVGYLSCNGQAVSRTEYQALFDVIGTIYGVGDGSTTFNIPDAAARSLVSQSVSHSVGEKYGEAEHTLTIDEMPVHNHAPNSPGTSFLTGGGTGRTTASGTTASLQTTTEDTGGGQAHNNIPPVLTVHYIIFAGV